MAIVTCRTEGCGNADRPIELAMAGVDADDQPWTALYASCGACGQQITDIQVD